MPLMAASTCNQMPCSAHVSAIAAVGSNASDEVVPCVAQTKNGKQVLNLADKERAQAFSIVPEGANTAAVLSEGRKLLLFPLEQIPEMSRGRGVLLQKSKADRLSDAQAFVLSEGLPWANRIIPAAELKFWRGERAQAGRLPEKGWPRAKRFKD